MNEGFFETLVDFCSGKLLAVLQAYFDESARPGMFVVAGYAFASDQAREVKRELDAVFAPYGGLHMKELVHRSGKFKGISEGKKDYLVKTATTIIRKRFIYGAYVTLNTREFDSYAAKYIKGFGDAYSLCCYLAMVALVSLTRKYGDLTPIHYVFEAGHPSQSAAEYMASLAAMPELQPFFHYAGHSFLPKPDATPLQAADMLAWEAGKFKAETIDAPIRDIRGSLLSLLTADPKRYTAHHLEGQKLERYLRRVRRAIREQLFEEAVWQGIRKRVQKCQ